MYIPAHFKVEDEREVFSFIARHSFGQIVSQVDGRLFATHMPFCLSKDKTRLIGHLARSNPQHAGLQGQEALVTFAGPHAYISPSWYTSAGVPTWNYQAAHVYGHCRVVTDPLTLGAIVESMARQYESGFENPWIPDYRVSMLASIVGIEVEIGEVQCKYKLSQNRSAGDRSRVAEKLRALGSGDLAQVMENNE
jgi:transcriptional regulator